MIMSRSGRLLKQCADCVLQLGLDMEELQDIEEDAGLGNGGLGRLAGEFQSGCRQMGKSGVPYRFDLYLFSQPLLIVSPSQRASWTPWPLWVLLLMGTGSAMSSASSIRKFSMAGRHVSTNDGWFSLLCKLYLKINYF